MKKSTEAIFLLRKWNVGGVSQMKIKSHCQEVLGGVN